MAISGGNPWVTAAGSGGRKMNRGLLKKLFAGHPNIKAVAPWLFGGLIAHDLIGTVNQYGNVKLAREAARMKGELATPENLYAEAALPGAMAEAQQARNALLTQLSGGVIGPSLARGERLIGG